MSFDTFIFISKVTIPIWLLFQCSSWNLCAYFLLSCIHESKYRCDKFSIYVYGVPCLVPFEYVFNGKFRIKWKECVACTYIKRKLSQYQHFLLYLCYAFGRLLNESYEKKKISRNWKNVTSFAYLILYIVFCVNLKWNWVEIFV